MKQFEAMLRGTTPLLMHSEQLSDPLNTFAKQIREVTGKRKKTDADHEEISRLEFLGGLWLDESTEPCMPGYVVEALIRDGAKKHRMGKDAAAGVLITADAPLLYEGPRVPADMFPAFAYRRSVVVSGRRTIRTRPRFDSWSCLVRGEFDEKIIKNAEDVLFWLKTAGEQCGVGDWRPRFGRFEVE